MRSLEECKAEIFRRSEQKIKKKKSIQKAIFACCMPLLLCVVTAFSWLNAPGRSKDSAPEANEMADFADGALGTAGTRFPTLQVRSAELNYTITDSVKINQIIALLEPPTAPESAPENWSNDSQSNALPTENADASSTDSKYQVGGAIADTMSEDLLLTYTIQNGVVKQFSLKDHMLTDLTSGNIRTLSNQQLEQLMDLLAHG